MILYHAITTYHLIFSIIHREVNHKNDEVHILLPDYIKIKFPQYKNLKDDFFDEVITFENGKLAVSECDENFISRIKDYFDNKLKIENYSEIYVSGAQNFLGIYLSSKNIPFNFVEEASGILSRVSILESIVKNLTPQYIDVFEMYNLLNGANPNVKNKICNREMQTPGFEDEKMVDFDIVKHLLNQSVEFQSRVLHFFGVEDKINIPKNSQVILTQHFAHLNTLSYFEQKEIYNMVVDYFAYQYPLVFKPHPDDIMPYDILFNDSITVREKFPSELFPLVFNNKPIGLLTISSAAINNLENYYDNCIKFSQDLETNYEHIHKYYFVSEIIRKLDFRYNLYEKNTLTNVINNFLQVSNEEICKTSTRIDLFSEIKTTNNIIIIDDISVDFISESSLIKQFLNSIDDESIVIFINSQNYHLYYDLNKSILDYISVHQLTVSEITDEQNKSNIDKTECIYIYTRKESVIKMLAEVKVKKDLKYSKKTLSSLESTAEQKKIKVLEGILEATESRLNHYIQLEKELRAEIDKLNN